MEQCELGQLIAGEGKRFQQNELARHKVKATPEQEGRSKQLGSTPIKFGVCTLLGSNKL